MDTFFRDFEFSTLRDLDCLYWLISCCFWYLLDCLDDFVALEDLAKDNVLAVKVPDYKLTNAIDRIY
jgi:hypothetical protein